MKNKILLVTGASSDVGIELIKRVENNYDVVLAHYSSTSEKLEQMKQQMGERLVLLKADFSDITSVKAMIQNINQLGYKPDHIVHFPAPKAFNQKFHKGSWNDFSAGIEISVHSLVEILEEYLPFMAKKKCGKVIVMLTSYTLNLPPKYQTSYVTIKYALLGLMKSLAVEYADKGICVNGVSPDMIETKFLSNIPKLIQEQNANKSPLGRNLVVADVVPVFEYLLSDDANCIMGQNIGITGGR